MPNLLRVTLFILLLLLAACQEDAQPEQDLPTPPLGPTLTPEAQATDTPAPTATAADTATSEAEEEEAPPSPTAVPTETAAPTEAPQPAGAPATSLRLAPVVSGLSQPTYLTHAGDERLFVTEQSGRIQVIENGQIAATPFLDITDRVGLNANEQGLLSVAFHPDYRENGYFYVNYTDNNGDTVISRFQAGPDAAQADRDGEMVLLTVDQPYGNHNGGQLQFGPDGYLYVGMGDGGSGGDPQNHGQDPTTLLGALLRLDVDHGDGAPYAIPPTNPYADGDGGRAEVWAIGLRNPWRFTFDRETGDLFVADVGQNQYEEVNVVPAGLGGGVNYGWNIMEGAHCYRDQNCNQEGLLLPVVEYSHPQGGCSVTGGYVYRGQQYPDLVGNYLFADYCSGMVWSLFQSAEGQWQWSEQAIATVDGSPTSFGEDAGGELYIVDHGGAIYQIQQ
ncbi:MAG TPA: PQQ-dependent sugar dehydrogenase [Candidatus Sulfomarinibacteraceae bacterium]|nr:PQQ-dependent sugar dehydrogenase [Candidatus Sulfomarinibacteraceae bacterium]